MISCHFWKVSQTNNENTFDIKYNKIDLGQAHGTDARQEIKKFGREGTGKKYIEMQNARRELIIKQRVIKPIIYKILKL